MYSLFPENSDDAESTVNTLNSLQALIGGIAYGGYARKVSLINSLNFINQLLLREVAFIRSSIFFRLLEES